jgi:DNA-binding SARP family transcriptional activator
MNFIAPPDAHCLRPAESNSLSLTLFGVPAVTYREQPVELVRRQTRALLYRLGTTMEPLAREALAAMFWPDTDDGTARRNLARVLNLLRSELPCSDLLYISPASVALNRELACSDTTDLLQLCNSKDFTACAEGVNLYRGQFLSGFVLRDNAEFDSWQSSVQHQLERICLQTLDKLIQHRTDCGDFWSAIRFGRRYLEIDSLAERIHRQLIILYASVGERALAVQQFEECVMVLDRELGVDPLPETRAAFKAATETEVPSTILISSGAPDWHTLPSLNLPLIGRKQPMQQLRDAADRLSNGGFIFIVGEPGAGKSRLLKEFATERDALVLTGHSHIGNEAVPYHPIVEALRQAFASPLFGQHVAAVWLAEVERLLPEINTRFPSIPQSIGSDLHQGRARLSEALVQIFHALSTRRQVLLCLDDLQWADNATLGWLQYAATRFRRSRICVLATSRWEDMSTLAPLQRSLKRDGLMTIIQLEPLTVDATADVLQAAKPPVMRNLAIAARIHRATGGNAFFVLELVRELLEIDALEDPPEPMPLPFSIEETIQRRISRLNLIAKHVLEAAAVLGSHLNFHLLQSVTRHSNMEVADGLDELLRVQVLCVTETGITFQHDLARVTVDRTLTDWRKELLHKRVAEALGYVN